MQNSSSSLPSTSGSWSNSSLLSLLGPKWTITITNENIYVTFNGRRFSVSPEKLRVKAGLIFTDIEIEDCRHKKYQLNKLNPFQSQEFRQKLSESLLHFYYKYPEKAFPNYRTWYESFQKEYEKEKSRGWIWIDPLEPYQLHKPEGLGTLIWERHARAILKKLDPDINYALLSNLKDYIDSNNKKYLDVLIKRDSNFFDTVGKNPLTDEQRKAAACFAPRTLVIASAGSGKSSVLAAKSACAVQKGFFLPSEILLLAFNTDAAKDLRHKISSIADKNINVSTFHAFCLSVIGEATGKKPSLASFIDQGKDRTMMAQILAKLLKNPSYRRKFYFYDLFLGSNKTLNQFSRSESSHGSTPGGILTNRGEKVKSEAEKIFADWLFESKIAYNYEKKYPVSTADKTHRQYHPDFYLPQLDIWVEIWALADNEKETEEFAGYQKAKAWKRELHKRNKTNLLEIYARDMHQPRIKEKIFEELFTIFERSCKEPEQKKKTSSDELSFEEKDFASLLRTFQIHAYNNDLSAADLREKISAGSSTGIRNILEETSLDLKEFGFREKLFVDLYEPAEIQWRKILEERGEIDFEMMMRQAAEIIEEGKWSNPYRLIMIDEFQDTSQMRARILKALLKTRQTRLFAVGDDWQSINRFAGSDVSIMKNFSEHFGEYVQLFLTKTFRCSSGICETSSKFISRNPDQFVKEVIPAFSSETNPVALLLIENEELTVTAIKNELSRLNRPSSYKRERKTVAILGRFNRDINYLFKNRDTSDFVNPSEYPYLEISRSTIHKSKGLEYDYVIVARMDKGKKLGFPCDIQDNPIFDLAMPKRESFDYAEERRLLYVAITRARNSVTIISSLDSPSVFMQELINPDYGYSVKVEKLVTTQEDTRTAKRITVNPAIDTDRCPECGALLVRKTNRNTHQQFFCCSNYPSCSFTQTIKNSNRDASGGLFKSIKSRKGYRNIFRVD